MKYGRVVYRKVLARMALMDVSKTEVAQRLGVSYSTLQNKLCGVTDFTLTEALSIKSLLSSPEPLEDMFQRAETEA